jgi:hypothetical protein
LKLIRYGRREGMDKVEIIAIETNDGYYLSNNTSRSYYSSSSGLEEYIINNGNWKKSYHDRWIFTEEPLTSLKKAIPPKKVNYRYELIDASLESEKIPKSLTRDDVGYYTDDDYCVYWKNFSNLRSMYKELHDVTPETTIEVPFSIQTILKVDKLDEHKPFKYKVQKTQWRQDGFDEITEKDVKICLLDKIMFPDIVRANRPCQLTSQETYKIVRQHIKDNINPMAAEVTSDYDFCFKVSKKIRLAETKKFSVNVNAGYKRRKPKFETRYQTHRLVEVFEMTHESDNYRGYTPIKGFKGKNQTDLKEKIDSYLASLMAFINEPLVDCKYCHGKGVIVDMQTEEERRGEK